MKGRIYKTSYGWMLELSEDGQVFSSKLYQAKKDAVKMFKLSGAKGYA